MAWRLTGTKPLSEPMMVVDYRRIYASLDLNELIKMSSLCPFTIWIKQKYIILDCIIVRPDGSSWSSQLCAHWLDSPSCFPLVLPWWRHQTETFSMSLALCVGNSPVTIEFDVFSDQHWKKKKLHKQPWRWWFETPLLSLWHNCNAILGKKIFGRMTAFCLFSNLKCPSNVYWLVLFQPLWPWSLKHCKFSAPSRILAFWLMLSVLNTKLNKVYLILSYLIRFHLNSSDLEVDLEDMFHFSHSDVEDLVHFSPSDLKSWSWGYV